MKKLLLFALLFAGCCQPEQQKQPELYDPKSHHHWMGKIDFWIAMTQVENKNRFFIPDSLKKQMEEIYQQRSIDGGYKPYGN